MIHAELIKEYLGTFPGFSPFSEYQFTCAYVQSLFPSFFNDVLGLFTHKVPDAVSNLISTIDDTSVYDKNDWFNQSGWIPCQARNGQSAFIFGGAGWQVSPSDKFQAFY